MNSYRNVSSDVTVPGSLIVTAVSPHLLCPGPTTVPQPPAPSSQLLSLTATDNEAVRPRLPVFPDTPSSKELAPQFLEVCLETNGGFLGCFRDWEATLN